MKTREMERTSAVTTVAVYRSGIEVCQRPNTDNLGIITVLTACATLAYQL